jgi:hypothetical protein
VLLQQSAGGPLTLPDWIASRAWLREPIEQLRVTWLVDTHALRDLFTRNLSEVSSQLLSLAGGLARNVIQFAITLMALFVLYLDGEKAGAPSGCRGLLLRRPSFVDIGSVCAAVFGLLGTAVAQGDRLDRVRDLQHPPVLLGMVTALGSFLPSVHPG